ncbi:hypothetical protein, partial [Bacteroides xylanisolvens]|uniref:hypothetical protein n=1 Tax=Bacteroides xylanisolvens TaxID=371601 RepID=UPI00202F9D8F
DGTLLGGIPGDRQSREIRVSPGKRVEHGRAYPEGKGAVRILHKPLLRLLRTSYGQGIHHLGGLVQVLPLCPAHCLLPQEGQSPQGKNGKDLHTRLLRTVRNDRIQ